MSEKEVQVLAEKISNLKDDVDEIKEALFKEGFVKKVIEHAIMLREIKRQYWFIIGLSLSNLSTMVFIIIKGALNG